jgi:hypothetical protein
LLKPSFDDAGLLVQLAKKQRAIALRADDQVGEVRARGKLHDMTLAAPVQINRDKTVRGKVEDGSAQRVPGDTSDRAAQSRDGFLGVTVGVVNAQVEAG